MSHFTTITTQIKDLNALRQACQELGLEFLQDAEARGYNGARQRGEFIIRLKGPYDVVLNRQTDGSYSLTTDWWDGHVEKEIGPKCGRLLQLYAVHKASQEARKRGHTVSRKLLQNGTIKLIIGGI